MTFSTLARTVLNMKKGTIKDQTWELKWRNIFEKYLIPHFGDSLVKNIRKNDIEIYIKLHSHDLAKTSLQVHLQDLNAIFRSAVENGIINRNLAVKYEYSKQASPENEAPQAAYIGITRTDNSADAIHSIIKYRYRLSDHSDAELKIKVGGTEYTRVGSEPIYDSVFGYYFLYVSKSGGTPGEPITSISFNDVPLVENCATALTATEKDITEYSRSGETVKSRAQLKGYANETNYIHSEYESQKTYICDIFIGSGASQKEAMIDLMNMGCNMYLPLDMNKDADGKYIFIGYDRIDSVDYAVRDVICTVGKKAEAEIEIDGVTYQRARDRYIMNYDDSAAVSFNEGTDGYSIYLYYSYETDNAPIMNIAAAEKDYVPDNKGDFIWENVLTDLGDYCNFNDGVYSSIDGHSTDNRIYLYVNRIFLLCLLNKEYQTY